MTRLENWGVACFPGECYLTGNVYDHPNPEHYDGKPVRTTRVMLATGRTVCTRNTRYELGEPSPRCLSWLKDNGVEFDPENPLGGLL